LLSEICVGDSVADPECLSRISDPDFYTSGSSIPDPRVKKAPDPGSATLVGDPESEISFQKKLPDSRDLKNKGSRMRPQIQTLNMELKKVRKRVVDPASLNEHLYRN
jgi:hypothetical protein